MVKLLYLVFLCSYHGEVVISSRVSYRIFGLGGGWGGMVCNHAHLIYHAPFFNFFKQMLVFDTCWSLLSVKPQTY